MVLPIIAYGFSVLRKKCTDIPSENDRYKDLIQNLWDTLETSGGVGLAAPQINSDQNVFVVNSKLMYEEFNEKDKKIFFPDDEGITEVFCNARITFRSDREWSEIESCLSIPGIAEEVERPWEITIEYHDSELKQQERKFTGYTARIIQHEYDHTRGVLFIDHLPALRKRLLKSKLDKIVKGKTKTNYKISYWKRKAH